MSAAVESGFSHGEPREVPPGRIEEELREVWRAAAEAQHAGSVSRACILTLVGYADGPEQRDDVEAVLDTSSHRMPSRTILLATDPDGEERFKATVNTNFHENDHSAGRQLYSEEVHITAGGRAIARLPNMVEKLRVTDVPAVLYWPGPVPREGHPGRGVLRAVDRLIVDSRDYRDPRDLCVLFDLVQGRVAVGDLSWQRLLPWRTLLASLFDGPPFAQHVHQLDRISLVRSGSHPAATYLFAGWLASRLGWRKPLRWECDEDSEAWRLLRPDGEPVVLIIRSAPGFHDGLCRVGIESSRHDSPVSLVIERGARLFKLRGTGLPPRSRTVADIPDDELLVQALRSPEEDHVITQALQAAHALLSASEPV